MQHAVFTLTVALASMNGCSCGGSERKGQTTTSIATPSKTQPQATASEKKERVPKARLRAEHDHQRGLTFALEQLEGRDEYAGKLLLERKKGEAWGLVESVTLSLHPSCDKHDSCRALREGGAAAPPAYVWPVKIGAQGTAYAECPCKACMELAPGEYRLVATTCAGTHRLESDSFWVAE